MRSGLLHRIDFDNSSKVIPCYVIKQIKLKLSINSSTTKSFSTNNYNNVFNNSSTTSKSTFISEKLRNAQASEIFRYNYYQSKSSDSFITINDLDQLIVQERVRPSILIDIYAITGHGLGLLSRLSPKSCGNTLTSIVDESTTQQFNDSIRSMQLHEVINYDIKETLKYHRDLTSHNSGSGSVDIDSATSTSSVDNGNHSNEKTYRDNYTSYSSSNATTSSNNIDDMNMNVKTVLTTVVYHMLKLSEKY